MISPRFDIWRSIVSFYVTLGYRFQIPTTVQPDGSLVFASAMPAHQLERRRIDSRYPHMEKRLFDPQLYLSGLDAASSVRHCANLATYPWFGIQGLETFESDLHTQPDWAQEARRRIPQFWLRAAPSDPDVVRVAVEECIEFQLRFGCEALILPSPLTVDPSSDYSEELLWLDTALQYLDERETLEVPVFATIALADICVRYSDPQGNTLLNLILDNISARDVDGVYIVVEQGSEPQNGRQCTSTRTLWSVLELCHLFSQDCGLRVGVNFLGAFGLICEAAGAAFWSSGWYKSEYRLRLADSMAAGRAYPLYWSLPSLLDINLDQDFDRLAQNGLLPLIEDETVASDGLLRAARERRRVREVPAWAYSQSNIAAAREHFFLSVLQQEQALDEDLSQRRDQVTQWLESSLERVRRIEELLGSDRRTSTDHIQGWYDAFQSYRRTHNA